MRTADFDFDLPPELIAQTPANRRDASRLLVLHRESGLLEHRAFPDLGRYLNPGDLLVLNDSRVIPARLRGRNARTGGKFEILLLQQSEVNDWWALLRPGRRAGQGTRIDLMDRHNQSLGIFAIVTQTNPEGHRRLRFSGTPNLMDQLPDYGEVPLPPYIRRGSGGSTPEDQVRYQTVYARSPGSVAAPTAGLHFTEALLSQFRARGIGLCWLTLHIGLGTFAPVKSGTLAEHQMHEESFNLSQETADAISRARSSGGRIVAVGTTCVRVLESLALQHPHGPMASQGSTRIFIHPPFRFRIVDALLTNFHLPRSTLLMLVSAFAAPNQTRGRDLVLKAYAEAVQARYRFFSYGDAMLLL